MAGYNPDDPFDYGSYSDNGTSSNSNANKYSMTPDDGNTFGGGTPYSGDSYAGNPYGGMQGSNPYGGGTPGNSPYGNGPDANDPYRFVTDYSASAAQAQRSARPAGGFDVAGRSVAIPEVLTNSFLYMFLALIVTGFTALGVLNSPLMFELIYENGMTPFMFAFIIELVVVFAAQHAMSQNNVVMSAVLFFAYAVINGLTLSVIFLVYTASSIANVFFITAAVFGVMAAVGIFTKKDLTGIGSLCLFGLIGILIAGVFNMFFHSSQVDLFITCAGIIIFLGLTAYDAQKIKDMAYRSSGYSAHVLGLWGALQLYLDFINLFLKLLRILGKRRRR